MISIIINVVLLCSAIYISVKEWCGRIELEVFAWTLYFVVALWLYIDFYVHRIAFLNKYESVDAGIKLMDKLIANYTNISDDIRKEHIDKLIKAGEIVKDKLLMAYRSARKNPFLIFKPKNPVENYRGRNIEKDLHWKLYVLCRLGRIEDEAGFTKFKDILSKKRFNL